MLLAIVLKILLVCKAVRTSSGVTSQGSNTTCPPWYFPDPSSGECSFIQKLPHIVRQYGNSSELEMGFCMTATNANIVVSQCPYIPVNNLSHLHNVYQVLPADLDQVNSSLCAPFNRRGFLCSDCEEGYGLAAYRYYGLLCVQCSHTALNLIAYVLLLFVPPTLYFLILVSLKINVHSGHFTGFLYFSHTVSTTTFFFPYLAIITQSLFGYWPFQILLSVYGVWSLNSLQFLIPPFCVSPHLTTLQLISLGYVPSVYPLILCIVTYYLIELRDGGSRCVAKMWSPFCKLLRRLNLKAKDSSSIIHTFGTCILLSYGNNLFVTFSLFQSYALVSLNQNTKTLKTLHPLAVDLKTPFFHQTHIPYFVVGIVGGLFTIIIPLVLVLLFPTRVFPKLIQCCGLRRWHGVRTFMEVFAGSYKDGTEAGQRDYRFVAGIDLISRIAIGFCWIKHGPNTTLVQSYAWLITAMPFIIAAVCFSFFKPHRRLWDNAFDVLHLLLMAKLCLLFHFMFERPVSESALKILVFVVFVDMALPQAIMIIYFLYKLISLCCVKQQCISLSRNNQEEQEARPLI